jgi:hypothetical protein
MQHICDFITGQTFSDTPDERIRQRIERLLIEEKGYSKEDIEVNKEFEISLGDEKVNSKVDLVITIEGKRLTLIKCVRGSLESWQREVLSCARILDVYQIPFAVITNGEDAEVLDTLSGEAVGSGLGAIPSKKQALEALWKIEFRRLPEERIEKEKRIYLAFETIKKECD